MEKRQSELKLQELAQAARARLLSYFVVLALFGLLVSGDLVSRVLAVTDTTNATQNVSAGSLSIDQVPNNLAFNDGAPGATTLANIGNSDSGATRRIKITSTASASFTLSAYFNTNWVKGSNAAIQLAIDNTHMKWWPTTNGVLEDVSAAGDSEIDNVAVGSDAAFNGIASGNKLSALVGSSSSKGKYGFSNLTFSYNIPVAATAGTDYTSTIITELI